MPNKKSHSHIKLGSKSEPLNPATPSHRPEKRPLVQPAAGYPAILRIPAACIPQGPPRIIQGMLPAGVAGLSERIKRTSGQVTREIGPALQLPAGFWAPAPAAAGQPLPRVIQEKMQDLLRANLNDVRIHIGPQAASIGAYACTQGENVYFAPGRYSPMTLPGQQLLFHELTHVVQQRSSRIRQPFDRGHVLLHDATLESEALRNASSLSLAVQLKPNPRSASSGKGDVAQMFSVCGITITGGAVSIAPNFNVLSAGQTQGNTKEAAFELHAGFQHNPWGLIWASCCEVRHQIAWDSLVAAPNHNGFIGVPTTANVWHEDRDALGRRLGHRNDAPRADSYYYQSTDNTRFDQANGNRFRGFDNPQRPAALNMGIWYFRIRVIDTCNSNRVLATSPTLTIDWDSF